MMHLAPNAETRFAARVITILAAIAALAGCISGARDAAPLARPDLPPIKASFAAKGIAGMDRLDQDEVQRLCTEYAGRTLPADIAQKITGSQLSTVERPASGKLIGDWKAGEAIAQEGRGLQFSDSANGPQGGNCYACHQLGREEISYGNLGPTLLNYGKLHGQSDAVLQYTYAKIYNSQAYAACSIMPRFGHNRILTPEQIADLVALLMDPQSPVNQ